MVPNPTRFRHILLILLLLMLMVALPLSASAATPGTITASADHVDEGNYISLSTNMTGTVTWTSSNSSLATVSSNGLVYGKQAGQVTITASCPGYTDASITLWVAVPDGVYYLKNASSGLCMETVVDTAYVYTQNTGSATWVSQLWKISHVSNGNYIIRPFGDTSLAMTVGDSGYVTVEKDTSASAGIYWQISRNAFGYAFKHGGSNAKTAMPTVNGPTCVPVYPSSWTSSLTCHWELEKIQGVFIRDTATLKTVNSATAKTVESGYSYTLEDLNLQCEYYGNITGGQSWTSSSGNVASVNSSGTVTGIADGEAIITLSASVSGVSYTQQYKVIVTAPHTHSYSSQGLPNTLHPHTVRYTCECGDYYESFPLNNTCSTCLSNAVTDTTIVTEVIVFGYVGANSDPAYIVPIFTTVDCTVEYTCTYSYPLSMLYNYPPFASFSSSVVSSYAFSGDAGTGFPGLICTASQSVNYYSESNALIGTQAMQWSVSGTGNSHPVNPSTVYTLPTKPAYATTSVVFSISGTYPKAETVVLTAVFP